MLLLRSGLCKQLERHDRACGENVAAHSHSQLLAMVLRVTAAKVTASASWAGYELLPLGLAGWAAGDWVGWAGRGLGLMGWVGKI
jgi:hypothetical protein